METKFSSVINKDNEQTPCWDRYENMLRQLFFARDDQKYSHRGLIMENLDTMSFDEVFEYYKNACYRAINDARANGSRSLDWDILRAFKVAADEIDLHFAGAQDNHADAARKRIAGGKEQAFKSFFTSALRELYKNTQDTGP